MNLKSASVHISGSSAASADTTNLQYAQHLIAGLVGSLAESGAAFVTMVGREPRVDPADSSSPGLTFDWTVLETLGECLREGVVSPRTDRGKLVTAVVTEKTDTQIPADRRELWEFLRHSDALRLEYVETGWTSGAIRRQQIAAISTLLVALSGGEGVEHLAQEFLSRGKPVVPLDLDLGASTDPGEGRAVKMAQRARSDPGQFLDLKDPEVGAELLYATMTRDGATPIDQVVDGALALIDAISPPTVFYVRHLNKAHKDFADVETYFRDVVDPLVERLGYRPIEMGLQDPSTPWINIEIFDRLHYAEVVLVDLTGLRNNCFMEMGYGYGHQQRVLLMARQGTQIPFDPSAIEAHLWKVGQQNADRIDELSMYWVRHIDQPPLVYPRSFH